MKTISKPAALRLDHHITAHGAGHLSYQRLVTGPHALFGAPSADLLTLVIAEAMKRKAQAEIQRDSIYELPLSPERGHERGADVDPAGPDDYI
ncbi:hypothetical protein [Paraburkholderia caffeinilytica]|uniref:hypothetical protein n=1 Tax=Paraburkholderia caffeinilytica TaxID=1761016 RepID=UPI0038B92294